MKTAADLDPSSLKAFEAAARALNFTEAARRAAMTQSGVSQHIARIEEELGTQLFKRVNKKVYLTKAGEILLRYVEKQKDELSRLMEKIQGEVGQVAGLARYAMPHSCLFTPHFPLLLRMRRDFPGVDLDVTLCSNEEVLEKLLRQDIDFGFVTTKSNHPGLNFKLFASEEYVLVGRDKADVASVTRDTLAEKKFVAYPGMRVLFESWSENEFGPRKVPYESLRIAGQINSLHGAITMVENGVGMTVIPRHCAADPLKRKILHAYASPKNGSLLNEIFIVTLDGVELPRRVLTVLNSFWEMKKK